MFYTSFSVNHLKKYFNNFQVLSLNIIHFRSYTLTSNSLAVQDKFDLLSSFLVITQITHSSFKLL